MTTRVLLVEDEPLLAFDLAQHLAAAGYEVVGPAGTVDRALGLVGAKGCDIAVLDVNLGRETAEPIAEALRRRGIPFIALSGYAADQHPPAFAGVPSLTKPARIEELVALLARLTAPAPQQA